MVEWRDITGYEGLYWVSDEGDVKSTRKVLKKCYAAFGYPQVGLSKEGRATTKQIHRLVALAFLGEIPDGMQVRHLDGNPRNNLVSNLQIGTASENRLDSVRHGTHYQAGLASCAQGHPFAEDNVIVNPSRPTARVCRQCREDGYRRRCEAKGRVYVPKSVSLASPLCKNGHPRSTFTYVTPSGGRRCRACGVEAARRYASRKAGQQ